MSAGINCLRQLQDVIYSGEVASLRDTDPGKLVRFVLTTETNGFQLWLGLADDSTPDERMVEYVPAGEGFFYERDVAIEAAVTRTLRARAEAPRAES